MPKDRLVTLWCYAHESLTGESLSHRPGELNGKHTVGTIANSIYPGSVKGIEWRMESEEGGGGGQLTQLECRCTAWELSRLGFAGIEKKHCLRLG